MWKWIAQICLFNFSKYFAFIRYHLSTSCVLKSRGKKHKKMTEFWWVQDKEIQLRISTHVLLPVLQPKVNFRKSLEILKRATFLCWACLVGRAITLKGLKVVEAINLPLKLLINKQVIQANYSRSHFRNTRWWRLRTWLGFVDCLALQREFHALP